ncbi:MAG: HAD family hydrolase [Bacteroides sp.]|nr:HAD family hydrolase [Roseburia sp.]MCM1346548.1 HAD family hydrolase [Bacteroides sp.]MCM1421088.1 HAD family hydrolase [Bacteroides sp.]
MSSFKVALFDLDGTIFDTEKLYSVFWGGIGRKYHPEIEDFDKIIKGTTLTQIYERYFQDVQLQQEITRELDEWERNMQYEFVPGAQDFIADIRKHGVRCAVVTSSNEKKMQSVCAAVPEFVDMFDKILTAEMFAASKPNPDCYLLGAKVFGADIDECVVFEDAFTGLEAGMSAGMFTVGLATTNSREAIEGKCNAIFDDFTNLAYHDIVELL